jgi:hypothetical protein
MNNVLYLREIKLKIIYNQFFDIVSNKDNGG